MTTRPGPNTARRRARVPPSIDSPAGLAEKTAYLEKEPMHALFLHNSLSRRKERFAPIEPQRVRMYVCGMTVYDLAHIGNARTMVVFDVLTRLLRVLYPPVTYGRNITDGDNKINARGRESGEPIASITARTAADFHADMAALGVLPPDEEARATQHVPEMI